MQSLDALQHRAMEEFFKVCSYFGEDPKLSTTEAFFGIFSEFIVKFEVKRFMYWPILTSAVLVMQQNSTQVESMGKYGSEDLWPYTT